MRKHILIAIAVLAIPTTGRAERRIKGSEQVIAHDCADDDTLEVVGSQNFVTVVGTCKQIRVAGAQNHLTIASSLAVSVPGQQNWLIVDATDAIRASGRQNWIGYRRSVTPKKRTEVKDTGHENVIGKAD